MGGEVILLIVCYVPESHRVLDLSLDGAKSTYDIKTLLGWVSFGSTGFNKRDEMTLNYIFQSEDLIKLLKNIYNYAFSVIRSSDKSPFLNDSSAIIIIECDGCLDENHWIVPYLGR